MKLANIERGPPDAPPLVFLHGFLGSAEDWRPVMADLSRNFRCIAVDLPGHGGSHVCSSGVRAAGGEPSERRSHAPTTKALAGFMESFRELLDELRVAQCGLIGYSLGGRLALHFALTHPQVVEFLVLESASPGIEDIHERVARREADEKWAAMLEREGLPKFLDAWYVQNVFASLRAQPELLAEIKGQRALRSAPALAAVLRMWSPGFVPSLWPRLPQWRAPLLFIAGERDAKYVETGKRVAGLCPRASLSIVRLSGHCVHAEQPDDFLAALRAFPMIGS